MDKAIFNQYRDKFVRVSYMAGNQEKGTTGHLRSLLGSPDDVHSQDDGITGFIVTNEQWLYLVSDDSQKQYSAIRSEVIRADLVTHIEEIDLDHAKQIAQQAIEQQELARAGKQLIHPGNLPHG